MASLAAIMEGLQIGRRSELSARLQSEAVLRCETVMGEILSGVREAASAQGNRFDDDETGNWEWTAEVTEAGTTGLLQVTVLVEHRPGGEERMRLLHSFASCVIHSFSLMRFAGE